MIDSETSIEDIYLGTKEVSENLKFDQKKLQEWIKRQRKNLKP